MADAKFVLKEPNSKQPTLVYMFFYFNGQQLKYSTSQKINPKFWNPITQLAKETRQFPEYPEFNSLLKNLRTSVSNIYRKLINDNITPTPEKLRLELNEFLCKTELKNKKDFIDFIDELINNSTKKQSTINQYIATKKRLIDYRNYSKKNILFDSIDLVFYDGFTNFLTRHKEYSINTIGQTIKNIKFFMNEALERGLTNNVIFKSKRFKKVTEPSENIYLTQDEIDKLYNLDITDNPGLDHARDLFIIAFYTGLRFSDLVQLKEDNLIDNKSKLKLKTEKTRELVIIPLHKYIKQILTKHNGIHREIINNQKMNGYLKEIGESAKINDNVLLSYTKAGKMHSETFKKYELITSHTARRSFATNAYLNDVPTLSIMKITGHKTERAFLTYIKMSQEDNANKLLNHPFFKL
jgi:integrase